MTHRYAFRRQNTVSRPALEQQVYPLRVGDSLVTALERLCERDDRGRAFAMWRVDRQYVANNSSGADLYFRFDFVVRPRLFGAELGEEIDVHAFARKAHVLMSPVALRVWIDGTGAIVHEPPTLLTARYSDAWIGTRRDFNLNPQRWRQLPSGVQSAWMRDWPTLCAQRRGNAESAVLASAEYRDHIGKALKACTEETRMRRAQAASRLARLDGAARERERQEMARDEGLYAALQASLSEPLLLLDVVGAVFVADDTPFDA
jgi:ATP-dependent helicase HepA